MNMLRKIICYLFHRRITTYDLVFDDGCPMRAEKHVECMTCGRKIVYR